ncbi:MAG: hypothetical protein ABI162_00145 [Luteolibacter sp.]
MKTLNYYVIAGSLLFSGRLMADTYTNFIRQVQYPGGVSYDGSVASAGQSLSQLAIDPGGARFELWTVNSTLTASYLLSASYVGTYVPMATLAVRSEDTTSAIPRTRADRPFYVDVTISGLRNGADDPQASKSVNFYQHVQSYGTGGTGVGLDRTQATLLSQTSITKNSTQNLTFAINSVPGADRTKIRGEQRFSIFSIDDSRGVYQAPAAQLASQYIQIWPVADGSIAGMASGQKVRFTLPQLTLTLKDLYPKSTTYLQAYKGNPVLGTIGITVPGSSLIVNDSVPQNRVLILNNYDSVFDSEGRWTLEIITSTPFGLDRLGYVSFDLDRTIHVNGSVTTIRE